MDEELIVIRQLPVIEEQLRTLSAEINAKVDYALSLDVTEDNLTSVKAIRSELNHDFGDLEERRKSVKNAILQPYEQFNTIYKEFCEHPYQEANRILGERISDVENGIKQRKEDELKSYFCEYRSSLGLPDDFVDFEDAGISITRSASMKSLKQKAKDFLNRILTDISAIETQECPGEIIVEYRRCNFCLAAAMQAVNDRHAALEAERRRREEMQERINAKLEAKGKTEAVIQEERTLEAPQAAETRENIYEVKFAVRGTLNQLRGLKKFMQDGGYTYESI